MNIRLIIRFAIIISCMAFIFVSSCKYDSTEGTILDWSDKEIIFPDSIIVELQNQPVERELVIGEYDFAIYTILNADKGCTSCQLMLSEWERLMASVQTHLPCDERLSLIFVIESEPTDEIRDIIRINNFKYPVLYDPYKTFEKLNQFPKENSLRTFLINDSNVVKVIGNPIIVPSLINLYKNVLNPDLTYNIYNSESDCPVVASENRIPLGIIHIGEKIALTATMENVSDTIIQVDRIVTSCECVSTKLRKKRLNPGSSTDLRIFFELDTLFDYNEREVSRFIYVYFEGYATPLQIELYGYSL